MNMLTSYGEALNTDEFFAQSSLQDKPVSNEAGNPVNVSAINMSNNTAFNSNHDALQRVATSVLNSTKVSSAITLPIDHDNSSESNLSGIKYDFGNAKIAVLIPCFNESQTIGKVVQDFKRVLPQATIYVFNNNSTDQTAQIAAEFGAVVCNESRQGKGNVVRSMFRQIDADAYLMVDGDDTYDAAAAPEMIRQVLQNGVDMVIGDRLSSTYFTENKRPGHNMGNRLVRQLISTMFRVKHRRNVGEGGKQLDIMTGYRAMSFLFVKSFPILSNGFEIETEMTIHALDKNFMVTSLPVIYRDRPAGSVSKLNTISDGVKVLWTIVRLVQSYRPFFFFAVLASACAVLSLCFLIPVFLEYFHTGLVLRLPTMITGCFCLLCCVFCLFTGLTLDVVQRQQRQMFEMKLNELILSYKRLRKCEW